MSSLPPAVRLNEPHVVAESVDGEALVINLLTGTYYSARGTGDAAWQMVSAGHALELVASSLASRFAADSGIVSADLEAWVAQLLEEELVVPSEPVGGAPPLVPASGEPAWSAPTLDKFTDMQDLLLLDPVHEVADEGWPVRPDA
jgi:hypothetical protein